MPEEVHAKVNYGGLKNLVKAMSETCTLKVGLLQGKGGDDMVDDKNDLAQIGKWQEFGWTQDPTTNKQKGWFKWQVGIKPNKLTLPARSWLLAPLQRTGTFLKHVKNGLSVEEWEVYVAETGDLMSLAVMVGRGAVACIQEAFDTSGFGKWKALAPLTTMLRPHRAGGKPLTDTGELRNHITYEVNQK